MTRTYSAVVAGHICLDIIPGMSAVRALPAEQLFVPGRLLEIGAATISTGGVVSNTGLALHRLGIPTRLVAKVGCDPLGNIVTALVRSHGTRLADDMVVDPRATTSYSIIISLPDHDRFIMHCPGANRDFCAADVCLDRLSEAGLLHFGYPPVMRRMYEQDGRGLAELMERARNAGLTTSLDLCYPDPASEAGQADWSAILRAALPYVDIFTPSIEELLFMLDRRMLERLASAGDVAEQVSPGLLTALSDGLLDFGTRIIVIKAAHRGAYLRTAPVKELEKMGRARPGDLSAWADQELWAPCFKVGVVGTTGAGDATIAGFLSAFLRGCMPAEALTAAVAVGACSVEAADALSGIRPWTETEVRINQDWPRLPLRLEAPGWEWNSGLNLWQHR